MKRRSTDPIDVLLTRAVVDVVVREDLEARLRRGERLRVKLGIDPTGPRLHIGRAVALRKLRHFQELGHTVCLVIGDFTARLGDASDKSATRVMLTAEQVHQNMTTYKEQIGLILYVDKVEWSYNNDWLGPLRFAEVIELASHFTVSQMLERETFSDRYSKGQPIGLHEFLYPLLQGYDSVALRCDLEVGGTDQLFNLHAGRTLQRAFHQRPQDLMTFTMVYGLDGRKMSTSWGNTVFIADPPAEQYGKIMSMSDDHILPYFEACTDVPVGDLDDIEADLARPGVNPMSHKKRLAWEIVALYHGAGPADEAQRGFERVVQGKERPDEIPEVFVPEAPPRLVASFLVELGLAPSNSEARRLIEQGGVTLDDARYSDPRGTIVPRDGMIVRAGKRRYARVRCGQPA